ncbi:uncharacterized protein V1518DRAFT_411507 [Limtongia smithiae]|uniref:uncharacterized protein n=1 Tax=Limtongia smithiae TaxID=1125753 RepID=UPI0034CE1A09
MAAPLRRMRPDLRRTAFVRPWYVQGVDIAHRLTVLVLVGGTLYYTAFACRMLYLNNQYRREHSLEERIKLEEERQREIALAANQLPDPPK